VKEQPSLISLCVLETWPHCEDFLKELGFSGQKIKKQKWSVNFLKKPLVKRQELSFDLDFLNEGEISPLFPPHFESPMILKETTDFLAIHKPACLHSHPLSYLSEVSVLNWMASQNDLAKWLAVNRQGYDRGLLYRLDFETSGLLLYAKNEALYQKAMQEKRNFFLKKWYLTMVESSLGDDLTCEHWITPIGLKGSKMKVSQKSINKESQKATLKLFHLAHNKSEKKELYLVELHQGLRHQIRAQLAALSSPIVGDELYNGPSGERLFLHCWRYQLSSGEFFQDLMASGFEGFFDLHSVFEMIQDKLLSSES
jgi:23S rRNA pseudouridine1911/1915/1917 synthase